MDELQTLANAATTAAVRRPVNRKPDLEAIWEARRVLDATEQATDATLAAWRSSGRSGSALGAVQTAALQEQYAAHHLSVVAKRILRPEVNPWLDEAHLRLIHDMESKT